MGRSGPPPGSGLESLGICSEISSHLLEPGSAALRTPAGPPEPGLGTGSMDKGLVSGAALPCRSKGVGITSLPCFPGRGTPPEGLQLGFGTFIVIPGQ